MQLGWTEADGGPIVASDKIFPCMRCLPMGWSWAMWFVQQLHEQLVLQAVPEKRVFRDARPAPCLHQGGPG
eukprot:5100127-Alexandrium_andersonii.AAC.1